MHDVIRAATIALIVLGTTGLAYAEEFEGVIHMTMTHKDDPPGKVDWMIKGHKARVEFSTAQGPTRVMIVDAHTRRMLMPVPGQKMVVEMNMDATGRDVHMNELDELEIERTGKTDEVAGHSCDIWLMKDARTEKPRQELCVGKGFGRAAGFWMDPKRMQQSTQPAWVRHLMEEGGFALRAISYDQAGRPEGRMEAVAIENKSIDPDQFSVPADWTRQDVSAMQGAMMEMRKRLKAGEGLAGGPDNGKDVQQLLEKMPQGRTDPERPGAPPGEPSPDLNEAVRKLEEMLKQRQAEP